jgi:hypothetical protein
LLGTLGFAPTAPFLSTKPGLLREVALAQTTRNARCAMRVRNRRGRPPRSKPLNTDV